MNPLDELRAARPSHLGDAPVDPHTRQSELSRAFAQPQPVRRKNLKPVWGIGVVGAAAAVTAVAVLGSSAGGGTVPRAPASVQADAPPVAFTAKQLLLVAATSAAKEPTPNGKYWYMKTRSRSLMAVDGGYVMASEQDGESWLGDGSQWHKYQSLGTKPATAADQAAWEAAGSPATMSAGIGKKRLQVSTAAGKPYTDKYRSKYVYWLGRNVTLADMRALPSDEAKLKASLLKYYTGASTEAASVPMAEDAWLFTVAGNLVIDAPVTPEVRAAAFRMLADLPSVESLGRVTDSTGRSGTAIAIETDSKTQVDDPDKGVLQDRLIIDEKSGRALAREYVVVKPGGFQKGLKVGDIASASTLVDSGWVDTRTA
ncbi:hypothetical protein Acor_68600 [Acrocarpospora corrugata]|uniref:CU044_5270 family protein n=1 Tax=Acrocarpospora corrugata TaxID=35763 RepID=A0A5M3W9V7_9ACTN|nr:CU044_5270 family protein [Acrocarpospora corrugata]GES04792.1 hypothetical protein Acor_68600 [Acrocarpospora corrugata]